MYKSKVPSNWAGGGEALSRKLVLVTFREEWFTFTGVVYGSTSKVLVIWGSLPGGQHVSAPGQLRVLQKQVTGVKMGAGGMQGFPAT